MNKKLIPYFVLLFLFLQAALAFNVTQITGHATYSQQGTFSVENFPPHIDAPLAYVGEPGDLVSVSPNVIDPNGDNFTVTFGAPLNSSGQWQTTENDEGVFYAVISAYDGNSETLHTFRIILGSSCGDGYCDSDIESCLTCPFDCGSCPPTTGTTGGGGGGGGAPLSRIRELQEEIRRLKNETIPKDGGEWVKLTENFKAEIEDIYVELQEDEFTNKQITTTNYLNEPLFLRIDLAGEINNSIILDTTYLIVPANSHKTLDMIFLANKPAGTYQGEINLISSNNFQTVPVTLKIIKRLSQPELETLDIDVDVVTPVVSPGDTLKFKLSLRKTPLLTEEPEDVILKFLVASLDPDSLGHLTGAAITDLESLKQKENVIYQEELITLENVLSIPKEIEIPQNFLTGDYILNVNAKFKGKTIPLFAKFSVEVPWFKQEIFGLEKGFAAIFAALITLIWLAFLFSRLHYYGLRRFEVKLDRSSLPKKGPKVALIGKIAEKNKKAYLNLEDLKTHTFIAGTTGSGKTIAARVITEEALNNNISVIVFDPTTQWTGFLKKCQSRSMLKYYPQFSMKEEEAKPFEGKIHTVSPSQRSLNIQKLMQDKLNIFLLNKLNSKQLNKFIAGVIQDLFKSHPQEHRKLKLLIIFDEVHRLLPQFGGLREGYIALEKAVREFRKWGIGVVLISQVTEDLVGPIEANIATQIQMKTNDKTDLARIEQKYGPDFLKAVIRSPTGTGLLSNSSYNNGRPYFVVFRPIFHSIESLEKKELEEHIRYSKLISKFKGQLAKLEAKKRDVFDLKIELELAEKQVSQGKFDMAKIYLDSLKNKLKKKRKKQSVSKKKIKKSKKRK